MTDDHYPYLPRRSASEALLNELRSLNGEVQNLRFAVQNFSIDGEVQNLRKDLCHAVRSLGVIPYDDDDDTGRYLPAPSASKSLLEELSNLRDEVRGVRDAVQGIGGIGLFLLFITFALIVQAI